jgi:hypothetical protein
MEQSMNLSTSVTLEKNTMEQLEFNMQPSREGE